MSDPPDKPSVEELWVRLKTMADTYATKTDLAKSEGRFEKSIGDLKGDIGQLKGQVSTIKQLVIGIGIGIVITILGAAFAMVRSLE